MAGVVHSIDELVGHTPLMELDRFERQQHCGAHILAKLEFFNPTGSVKDRAALAMIQAAEQSGAEPLWSRPAETPASGWRHLPLHAATGWRSFLSAVPRWSAD